MKALIALLECLGFIINMGKPVLSPSQQVEFLNLVDTTNFLPTGPQDQENLGGGYPTSPTRGYQCSQSGTVHRQIKCRSSGCVSSPTVLLTSAEELAEGPLPWQSRLPAFARGGGGSSVVAAAPAPIEWQYHLDTFASR